MKCEYCNSDFIRKSTLLRHQKSAKYCISLQHLKIMCCCGYNGDDIENRKEKCIYNKYL